ncbi:metallophosphoesterase family protein [Candidatus Woesearchaeota archaeon]|nr:metallophosphoesterase family protein [Candidatus Woesearchaeota archaeon]
MKILAFTDVHGSKEAVKKLKQKAETYQPDCLVCAGDLTTMERGLDLVLKDLRQMKLPGYFIHGNHETEEVMAKTCKAFGFHFIHKKVVDLGDFGLAGFGGGGFSMEEPEFEQWAKSIKRQDVILLTHAPPYNGPVDILDHRACGNKSFRTFLENKKPPVHICGHLHEFQGKQGLLHKTLVINPGPFGRIITLEKKK